MGAPSDFAWRRLADGTVQISHRGRPVTSLRGDRADAFLAEVFRGWKPPQPVFGGGR